MQITSPSNPQLKAIRALRQRRARELSGTFLVEGIRPVAEAIQLGAPLATLLVAPELLRSDFALDLVAHERAAGTAVLELSAAAFAALAEKDGPQGLAAVVRQQVGGLAAVTAQGLGWLALDGISDPGNLGTILRTADAVGVTGVILVGETTDPYDPAAVRASMGALFTQRIVRATPAEFCAWQPGSGFTLVGTSDAAALAYRALRYPQPLLLLMGSERTGMRPELAALCQHTVRIPMTGRSDSLNLAVATGVVLYEVYAQLNGE